MSEYCRPFSNAIITSIQRNLSKVKMPKMNFKIEKKAFQLWVFPQFFLQKSNVYTCSALHLIIRRTPEPYPNYFTRTFHLSCSIKSLNSRGQWVDLFSMTGHPCQIGHHSKGGGAVAQFDWVMELARRLLWNLQATSVRRYTMGDGPKKVS